MTSEAIRSKINANLNIYENLLTFVKKRCGKTYSTYTNSVPRFGNLGFTLFFFLSKTARKRMTTSLPPYWITSADGKTKLANPDGLFSQGFTDDPHNPRFLSPRGFNLHGDEQRQLESSGPHATRVVLWESHIKRVEQMEESMQLMMDEMKKLIAAQKQQQQIFESLLKAHEQSTPHEPATEPILKQEQEALSSHDESKKRKIDTIEDAEAK